jgi:hypothetical protein
MNKVIKTIGIIIIGSAVSINSVSAGNPFRKPSPVKTNNEPIPVPVVKDVPLLLPEPIITRSIYENEMYKYIGRIDNIYVYKKISNNKIFRAIEDK